MQKNQVLNGPEWIDKEKYDYAEKARLETRDEMLRQVEEKWYEPINNRDLNATAQPDQPSLVRTTNFDLDQKLKSIFRSCCWRAHLYAWFRA